MSAPCRSAPASANCAWPGSDADFGDFSDWTVVDNRDGTWSVGARYIGYAPGRARGGRYTTCILRKTDNGFTLVKLSHLR